MTPEISHRCPSCGVSVRDRDALFCYECGKPLSSKTKKSEPAEAGEVSPDAAVADKSQPAAVADETAAEPKTDGGHLPVSEPVIASADKPADAPSDSYLKPDESTGLPPGARRGDKTRERLHRASEVARGVTRGVIEEPAKRVEKIRQVSNVVIEEASYDPSLRFVLVALGLFVVFIILLVLSKVMG
ncbi:MAG TPA: zinc ribbon domain-containing protein [Pyrinomonadaceae bacterium]